MDAPGNTFYGAKTAIYIFPHNGPTLKQPGEEDDLEVAVLARRPRALEAGAAP